MGESALLIWGVDDESSFVVYVLLNVQEYDKIT